jgi:hypothetical protein
MNKTEIKIHSLTQLQLRTISQATDSTLPQQKSVIMERLYWLIRMALTA